MRNKLGKTSYWLYIYIIFPIHIFFIITVPTLSGFCQEVERVAILPFINKCGFSNDNWNISKGIASVLADSLSFVSGIKVVNMEEITNIIYASDISSRKYKNLNHLNQLANKLSCDKLIVGNITKFSISRFNAGNPILAGYESYKAEIETNYKVYETKSGTLSEEETCKAEITNRNLGVTLLGKPSENRVDYADLDSMKFGSEEFFGTIIGQAVLALRSEFISRVINHFSIEQSENFDEYGEASVILVQGPNLYLNAGKYEKVYVGDILPVYTRGEELKDPKTGKVLGYADKKIGKIQITQVRDAHLSLAKILDGEGEIKAKDTVRIRKR